VPPRHCHRHRQPRSHALRHRHHHQPCCRGLCRGGTRYRLALAPRSQTRPCTPGRVGPRLASAPPCGIRRDGCTIGNRGSPCIRRPWALQRSASGMQPPEIRWRSEAWYWAGGAPCSPPALLWTPAGPAGPLAAQAACPAPCLWKIAWRRSQRAHCLRTSGCPRRARRLSAVALARYGYRAASQRASCEHLASVGSAVGRACCWRASNS
jgi:hypothetical protein